MRLLPFLIAQIVEIILFRLSEGKMKKSYEEESFAHNFWGMIEMKDLSDLGDRLFN